MNINDNIPEILKNFKNVAIVGVSDKPFRSSYGIANFLMSAGFRIIPVNPGLDLVLGEKCYPSLLEVTIPVEIVNIFRRPEYVVELVDQAIQIKAKVIWMQTGVINKKAAEKAVNAGLFVVMDRCIKVEYRKYFL